MFPGVTEREEWISKEWSDLSELWLILQPQARRRKSTICEREVGRGKRVGQRNMLPEYLIFNCRKSKDFMIASLCPWLYLDF